MKTMTHNIRKNYLYVFLRSFSLTDGIWMLYLVNVKGLTLYQAGLAEAIFHITSILMEIPTGAVADIWGRRVSRAAGRVLAVVSALLMISSQGLGGVALAFTVSALSYNLESGAGQAFIYDTLKQLGREADFARIEGHNELITQTALIGGLTLGGWIAEFNFAYAYAVTAVIGAVAAWQALSMTEPAIDSGDGDEIYSWRVFKRQISMSVRVIRDNRMILYYMLLFESLGAIVTSVKFYLQSYLAELGFSLLHIGFTLSAAALFCAILATQSHRLDQFLGERRMVRVLPLIFALLLWGFTLSGIPVVFFVAVMGFDAVAWIVFSKYLNAMIPSDRRATVLSMSSMIFSLFMIVLFPLIGSLGDRYGLALTFRGVALVTTLIAAGNYYIALRRIRLDKESKQ